MEGQQLTDMIRNIYTPLVDMFLGLLKQAAMIAGIVFLIVLVLFFLTCRINPFRLSASYLKGLNIRFKYYDLLRWVLYDVFTRKERGDIFRPFGFTIFCGRQGSGKTISMVQYLNRMKEQYPKCKIVTNFSYSQADYRMNDWRDFLNIRNGTDGVIFAIDEIHSEYSAASWKDFPETILSEVSQQRKQRIKIVATAQVFGRVVKPLREQAFSVIECRTWLGRLTTNREYDASDYTHAVDGNELIKKLKPIWKSRFVQPDALRECYDTYEKIERLKKLDYIPRAER